MRALQSAVRLVALLYHRHLAAPCLQLPAFSVSHLNHANTRRQRLLVPLSRLCVALCTLIPIRELVILKTPACAIRVTPSSQLHSLAQPSHSGMSSMAALLTSASSKRRQNALAPRSQGVLVPLPRVACCF
ncbi:hypothetical protein GQ54DRAFT_102615 [Martensiomyces pterosporus]|nr:hypothetical protein GQ54DRAFT_102615 [Martensiomyces pterosporus]